MENPHYLAGGGHLPGFILMLVDGAGPYRDPYYVNAANNQPHGDALARELIPVVE